VLRQRAFKVGVATQIVTLTTAVGLLVAIKLRWIDIVELGLAGGIDAPSPWLMALQGVFFLLPVAFAGGLGLCIHALLRCNEAVFEEADAGNAPE
jgi:hypothetical protein